MKCGKVIVFVLILTILGSCRVTRYENYGFQGYYVSEDGEGNVKSVYAYIPFYGEVDYEGLSFYRDSIIRSDPYTYWFSLFGDFDNVVDLNAYFLLNKTEKIPIPISSSDLLVHNKSSKCKKLCKRFSTDEKFTLSVNWFEVESLSVLVNFTAIENGERKEYRLSNDYEKEVTVEDTNITFEAIMGI